MKRIFQYNWIGQTKTSSFKEKNLSKNEKNNYF